MDRRSSAVREAFSRSSSSALNGGMVKTLSFGFRLSSLLSSFHCSCWHVCKYQSKTFRTHNPISIPRSKRYFRVCLIFQSCEFQKPLQLRPGLRAPVWEQNRPRNRRRSKQAKRTLAHSAQRSARSPAIVAPAQVFEACPCQGSYQSSCNRIKNGA